MGEFAVLVECADLASTHRLHAALRRRRPAEVVDVVPGWDSVLVTVSPDGAGWLDRFAATVGGWLLPATEAAAADLVEIAVTYDGEDLADVAALTGLTVDEVAARHAAPTYTVAFVGFSPGFAYLAGLDPALAVPRLATPRAAVPAGAVAIGGVQTGIYPQRTPGGWRIVGHTDTVLFDPAREPPALLAAGTAVRLRPA